MDFYCPRAVTFCFKYLNLPYPLILRWDSPLQKFSSLGRQSHQSILWLSTVLLVNGFIITAASIFSLYKYKEITTANLLISGLFLGISYFDYLIAWSLFWNVEDVVNAFEKMRTLTLRLRGNNEKEKSGWKMNANLLMSILQQLVCARLGLPTIVTLLKADPLYNVVEHFELRNMVGDYALVGIRWVVVQIYLIEVTRLYGSYLVIVFYWLEMLSETLRELRKVSVSNFLRLYMQCFIANQIWGKVLSDWVGILLTTMFYLIVATIVFSIRFMDETPFFIYFFNLTVAFCTIVSVYIIFKFLTGALEDSEGIIRDKKFTVGVRYGRRTRKELDSLRAISYKMGPCFRVTRETKCSYYSNILENAINGILFK